MTLTPIGPVVSLRFALMTRSSARGRSGAAFRKSRRSNSSSATASPPVARSGIRTPPNHMEVASLRTGWTIPLAKSCRRNMLRCRCSLTGIHAKEK